MSPLQLLEGDTPSGDKAGEWTSCVLMAEQRSFIAAILGAGYSQLASMLYYLQSLLVNDVAHFFSWLSCQATAASPNYLLRSPDECVPEGLLGRCKFCLRP